MAGDGAVKFYQVEQIQSQPENQQGCFYPGKVVDPELRFFLIGYPWAITNHNGNCKFVYPLLWPKIAVFVSRIFGQKSLLYIPIVFFSLSCLLFIFFLATTDIPSWTRFLIISTYFFSFPLLTILDFSENGIYLFFSILALLFYRLAKKAGKFDFLLLGSGFSFGFAFLFRMEILILVFFFLGVVAFQKDFKTLLFTLLGFVIPFGYSLFSNYSQFGHFFGLRYLAAVTENANAKATFLDRLQMVKAYLIGNEFMEGLFLFNPVFLVISILSILWVYQSTSKEAKRFTLAGLSSLIFIPFYTTVYGGAGFFGLRYLEVSCLFALSGFAISFPYTQEKFSRFQVLLLSLVFGLIFYPNYLSTMQGVKVLKNGSKDWEKLEKIYQKSDRVIVHSSQSSQIYAGFSYLSSLHFLVTNEDDFQLLVAKLKSKEKFIFLKSPATVFITPDIPKALHFKYNTNFSPSFTGLVALERIQWNHIEVFLFQKSQ